MKFSVVIAAFNEGAQIASALKRLKQISSSSPLEVIVVDGKSDDDTVEQARRWADHVIIHDKPNRGAQLHAGAQKASGDLLFFLRADAQPPGNWQQMLEHFWLLRKADGMAGSVFSIDYGAGSACRLLSGLSNMAARLGRVDGDHGMCTTPELYARSGGYPPLAFGEDLAFADQLARLGRIRVLSERIRPAARRLRSEGAVRWLLRRIWLDLKRRCGVDPDVLWHADIGQ